MIAVESVSTLETVIRILSVTKRILENALGPRFGEIQCTAQFNSYFEHRHSILIEPPVL